MPAPKLIPLWAVIAISAGMTAVSAGLSYALRPNTKLGENKPNEYMTNIVDTDSFVPVLYGMAVAPILVVFLDASPDDVNELHCVAVFSHGRIEGIETVYFDNMEIVAKKKDGQLDVLDKYEKNVWFYHRPGKPGNIDLPYETCVKTFGRWTSKHTSGMLASIYMIARYKQELFSSIPNVFVKAKGLRVYDPRDGQTKWSNNPVLCILEFLTNKVYGKRADINTEINVNSFIAEANYCDEKINWKVSSPKRIRFRLLEKDDNPLEAGTYYIKYSYCYGSTITSEDQAYTFNESIISTAASVTVTSSYGEVLVDGLGVPAEDSGITLKRIYMSTSAGGTYYLIKELDPDITTFRFTTGELGAAYNGNGVPTAPTTVPTVTYTDFSNSGLQKNRKYKYKQTFVKNPGVGETETVPSPASQVAKTTNNAYAVRLKTPDTADEEVTHVRWYRTEGYTSGNKINSDYKKLADVAIATKDYLDKIADGSLGATNPPSSSTLFSKVRRFKCDGVLDTGADQDENLEKLLTSCRGRLYNEGGKYRIFIPKITIPESFELNEDNIIGGWNFRILGMNDRPNVVKASYINPEAEWKSDTVLWPKKDADNFYLKDDNDFKKVMDIDLPFTIDRRIAKTICQVIRKESRNNIVAELTAKEEARKLTGGCLVNVTHSTPGWDKKKFWVDGVGIYPNATVRLILVEYNEDDYNYETLEDETLPGADTDLGDPLDPPDEVANVQFSEESYTNKGVRSWRLKVTFDTPTDTFWDYSEVYVKYGSSNYELYKAVTKESDGVFYIHPIQEFTNYYIKILSISTLGISQHIDDVTEWSHTTGNVTNPPDVSNIGATVRGDTVTLSWAYLTDITDFDYFEIREGSDWDTSILISKTKSTSLVLVGVSGGTHTYRIKAVDTAGNYSANDAYTSPAAFVETSASWTDRITTDFTGGTHIGTEAATVGGLKSVRRSSILQITALKLTRQGGLLAQDGGDLLIRRKLVLIR